MPNEDLPGFMFVLPWKDITAIGGVNEVVKNLWDQIEQQGEFRPLLLVNSWDHALPHRKDEEGRTTIYCRLRFPWGPRKFLSYLYHLPASILYVRRLLKHENVAVVNVVYPELSAITFAIIRLINLYKGKILLNFQGTDVKIAAASRGVTRLFWRGLLSSVDTCVGVSEHMRDEILSLCPRATAVTIYNGVNLAKFRAQGGIDHSFDAQLSEGPYILNVGEFIPRKGQDVLIKAFARLAEEFPRFRLVLVGRSGPFLDVLAEITAQNRLTDRVMMVRDVPHSEIASFFEQASIFVLPSRGEGFALAALEAAAFELPIIATDVDGAAELVADGANGWLVPVDDVDQLAEKIRDLLSSPQKAKSMGKRNLKIASDKFEWSHAYQAYSELISVNKGDSALGRM